MRVGRLLVSENILRLELRYQSSKARKMPVEPIEINFETSVALAEARTRIIASIAERKGKIKVDYPTELVAGLGSGAKTRLLGGMWIDKRNLPRDLAVSLRELANGSQVKVTVRDTMGIGSRAGLREKYQRVMYEDAFTPKSRFQDAR